MVFRQKKGAGGLAVPIIIVIALFIILAQVVSLATRECSQDKDCAEDSYCGSDFQCHKYPTIKEANYIPAALILGLCIIAGAVILRWKKT